MLKKYIFPNLSSNIRDMKITSRDKLSGIFFLSKLYRNFCRNFYTILSRKKFLIFFPLRSYSYLQYSGIYWGNSFSQYFSNTCCFWVPFRVPLPQKFCSGHFFHWGHFHISDSSNNIGMLRFFP